jgi:hypothetical protein
MNIHTVCEIMSQNLAAKATTMNKYKELVTLTGSLAAEDYESILPQKTQIKLRTVIEMTNKAAYRQLRAERTLIKIPVNKQISVLQDVPLKDKRNLLDDMPIVPVSVGAAFLGVAEADLHDVNAQNCGVFGNIYLRRRCNSMNELLLIAQNPAWLRDRSDSSTALVLPDSSVLDSVTYVDIRTAAAFTNMDLDEVSEQVQSNGRFSCYYGPTYRVSDLEEIRVAKLNAQQQ